MAKFKFNNKKTISDNIDELCLKFGLAYEIKEAILEVSKNSYIKGSNDCHKVLNSK